MMRAVLVLLCAGTILGGCGKPERTEAVIQQADAALAKGDTTAALDALYGLPAKELREDEQVKAAVARARAALAKEMAPGEASAFAANVDKYAIPELRALSTPRGEASEVWRVAGKLEETARDLEKASELPLDANGKAARTRLKKELSARQVTLFPQMRLAYGTAVAQAMWPLNVEVQVSGPRNHTIRWTGARFASNATIQASEEAASQHTIKLRFAKSQYRWFSGADQTWSYDLKTPSDAAIGYWEGQSFKQVE